MIHVAVYDNRNPGNSLMDTVKSVLEQRIFFWALIAVVKRRLYGPHLLYRIHWYVSSPSASLFLPVSVSREKYLDSEPFAV